MLSIISFSSALAPEPANACIDANDLEALKARVAELEFVNATATHGRELFPGLALGRRHGGVAARPSAKAGPVMSADASSFDLKGKVGVKTLEMLALNDDLNTVVSSNSYCTRRQAMARAAGLASGLSMASVAAPGFAAATKTVKMGTDAGQLVFVPDEVKICSGDSVTWVNNKGGPHNVVFNADAIPSGVDADSISMDDQLGDEGATYSKSFATKGSYGYYCEPHAGAGMLGTLIVE
jgi:plastocyanin